MAATKLSLKLLVDEETNKVVLAESQRDFVDVLFSFLTLPVGTIVRMLNKQSPLGCMDRLYESVEKLDLRFMETKACKTMLLRPRSAAEQACEALKFNVDDTNARVLYCCRKWDCRSKTFPLHSHVQDAKCPCGLTMDEERVCPKKDAGEDGVFVKGEGSFSITDDLRITPSCADATLSVLHKFEFKDFTGLKEMTFEIGKKEILNLLKRSLSSETPLTDVFLRKVDVNKDAVTSKNDPMRVSLECKAKTETRNLKMKLFSSKAKNSVLYAEAGGEIVDFLFSFLTFPVGSIIRLLDKRSCIGCLDNLYKSMEELIDTDYLVSSAKCSSMLLSPKLAPMFACSSQLLRIEEKASAIARVHGCQDCCNRGLSIIGTNCTHGIANVILTEVNPKLPSSGTESGGGFTKEREVFMITDELEVTPLSCISSILTVGRSETPVSDLVVREVSLSEHEALNMLKASLTSNRALSKVFCRSKRRTYIA